MKRIIASLLLAATANATVLLDRGTNNFYVTNNVTTGSTALTNNVTNVIAAGSFVAGSNAFGAASFAPQIFYTGVTNVILSGGLTGSLTNGVLTVDGSTAALGVAAPTSGTYVAQSKDGVITWEPVSATISTSYNSTVWSTQWGVTNFFYAAGRTTQTWTWSGGTTQIMIKAWGGGGGGTTASGNGGFIMAIIAITNNQTLSIQVPYGGGYLLTQYVSEVNASYPGGGSYTTNATTARGAGGGYASVYDGTNIIIIAGGGAGAAGSGSGSLAHGGWPSGISSAFGVGGTQTAGGIASGTALAGSYLQGGSGTSNVHQAGGGGGYYGGGGAGNAASTVAGGGGSSYWNPNYVLYGYGVVSLNSGDINYSSSYGAGSGANASGQNGLVLIITPTP